MSVLPFLPLFATPALAQLPHVSGTLASTSAAGVGIYFLLVATSITLGAIGLRLGLSKPATDH